MLILPIRTESVMRRTPSVNLAIIAINVIAFSLFNTAIGGDALAAFSQRHLVFDSINPRFHQFFTYQFLHADIGHLLGNMLFLWVFGNSVNSKMGDFCYALFYLSGGIFAAWGYAAATDGVFQLVGASGAIAAVTTAYLALSPRSHVTVLIWFFLFIHFIEVPAMILILLKIVVWDNIIAPGLAGGGNIAHGAHLAGYLFGFAAAMIMLLFRGLPRDQFDMLALWKRWHQRRAFAAAMSDPKAAARARYGTAANIDFADEKQREAYEQKLDEVSKIRTDISDALAAGDQQKARDLYATLLGKDETQCLAERQQLEIARSFFSDGYFPQAAAAYDNFLRCYPGSPDRADIQLLVGIIYARDLRQYETAENRLAEALSALQDNRRKEQCEQWLTSVQAALGKDHHSP